MFQLVIYTPHTKKHRSSKRWSSQNQNTDLEVPLGLLLVATVLVGVPSQGELPTNAYVHTDTATERRERSVGVATSDMCSR